MVFLLTYYVHKLQIIGRKRCRVCEVINALLQSQRTLHNQLAHKNMDGSKMKATVDIKISEEYNTLFGTYSKTATFSTMFV